MFALNSDKYDEYVDETEGKYFLKGNCINNIDFSQANILEDIDNIDSNTPSFVMCRNMWPYVDDSEYQNFANQLYEKLAPGSCIMLGDFDYKKNRLSQKFPRSFTGSRF